jgi:hypothetical protein
MERAFEPGDVVSTLGGDQLSESDEERREAYADWFFAEHYLRLRRRIRGLLRGAGLIPSSDDVDEAFFRVFRRVARRGVRKKSLVARYRPSLNPATADKPPRVALDMWFEIVVRSEAKLVARNMCQQWKRRQEREVLDNGQ